MDPTYGPSKRRRRHLPNQPQQHQGQHRQQGPHANRDRDGVGPPKQKQQVPCPLPTAVNQPPAVIKSFDQLRAENASANAKAASTSSTGPTATAGSASTVVGPTVLLRRPQQGTPSPTRTPPPQHPQLPRQGVQDEPRRKGQLTRDPQQRRHRRQKQVEQRHQSEQQEQRELWHPQEDERRLAGRQNLASRTEAQPVVCKPALTKEKATTESSEVHPMRSARRPLPAVSTDTSSAVTLVSDEKKDNRESRDEDKEKRRKSKKKKRQFTNEAREKKKKPSNEPKTKVVVRRLPPNLPEGSFWDSVKSWVNDEDVDWKCFVPGKLPKSRSKVGAFGRAYVHFKTLEMVLAFHRDYDGYVFEDSSGNSSKAVVEFAPFQGIPKEKKKKDQRQGTIGGDPDFLAFVERLKADPSAA